MLWKDLNTKKEFEKLVKAKGLKIELNSQPNLKKRDLNISEAEILITGDNNILLDEAKTIVGKFTDIMKEDAKVVWQCNISEEKKDKIEVIRKFSFEK